LLLCVSATTAPETSIKPNGNQLDIELNGTPFTSYVFAGDVMKTFFHPLRDARGVSVTRGYPIVLDVPGETKDHPHHKGLWFAHGDTNGVDFWAEKGKIVHRSFNKIMTGEGKASFDEKLDWVASDGKVLLHEARSVSAFVHDRSRVLDINITLTAGAGPVEFGDTKEGTFAIRVATAMDGTKGGTIEDSEGRTTESSCWGKGAAWCDYSGMVEGERVGIAILDHPSNMRHPVRHHVRAYGLHAVNPFGRKAFDKNEESGAYTLEPGKSLTLRYRVVIHQGDAKEGQVAVEFEKFAKE
jgi:hypothetical protein